MNIALLVFLIACLIACVTDARTRRIPNALTYGAIVVALVFAAGHGPLAFIQAFGIAVLTLVLGSVLLSLGWLGGGDIKLLAAGAATIGYPSFLLAFAYILVAGGAFAAITAYRDLMQCISGQTTLVTDPNARRVPYALAICAGTAYFAASESFAPWLQLVR
jgi:prepilin peptidase CpaA